MIVLVSIDGEPVTLQPPLRFLAAADSASGSTRSEWTSSHWRPATAARRLGIEEAGQTLVEMAEALILGCRDRRQFRGCIEYLSLDHVEPMSRSSAAFSDVDLHLDPPLTPAGSC